jgi:regulator of extracellular matrix RemA (YlzA/DUF370 family)
MSGKKVVLVISPEILPVPRCRIENLGKLITWPSATIGWLARSLIVDSEQLVGTSHALVQDVLDIQP